MSFDDEFFAMLTSARFAVIYDGKKNSLVEWTLSEQWTQPDWLHKYPKIGICNGTYQGSRTSGSGKIDTLNSFAGEIGVAK